jgi:hypothetical protein
MRRLAIVSIVICILLIIAGLSQTAWNPEDICGQWYSSDDQQAYLFEEGLIFYDKYSLDRESLCGAYSYCRNSVFLFVNGIDGLETEKEIYYFKNRDGSFLCENDDGTGIIYFIRYNE